MSTKHEWPEFPANVQNIKQRMVPADANTTREIRAKISDWWPDEIQPPNWLCVYHYLRQLGYTDPQIKAMPAFEVRMAFAAGRLRETQGANSTAAIQSVFCNLQGAAPSNDAPSTVVLSPNEQAFLDVLTDEGQTGPDVVAKLARAGYTNIDRPAISKMWKLPHMKARGVRHRTGAGYYRVQLDTNLPPT